jgi:hypothetical protein
MDDKSLRGLFSGKATLKGENDQTTILTGPSLLMSIVMGMESDSAYLSKKGCISRAKLHMLYATDELAGVYKTLQLKEFPGYSEKFKRGIAFWGDLTEDGGIPALQYEYKNCVGSVDFFFIPLVLIHGIDPTSHSRHANGILVSKSKGTYFRIEPQYSSEDEPRMDTPKIYEGIEKALNEIGAKDFKRTELNTVCPQNLTNDQNCLFWTAYIAREIIRNIYKNQDPNTTIASVTARGLPQLQKDIDTFKQEIWIATLKFLAKERITWEEYDALRGRIGLPVVGVPPRVVGGYFPAKYFQGLSTRKASLRKRELTRRKKMSFKNPKAYVPFKTDKGVKTRKSSYTERFHRKYPGVKSLSEIAKATGISKSILDTVYDRGMAAWRTGHRPGASQQAWGMARVHSFVMKGKTWRTADADLARKV